MLSGLLSLKQESLVIVGENEFYFKLHFWLQKHMDVCYFLLVSIAASYPAFLPHSGNIFPDILPYLNS